MPSANQPPPRSSSDQGTLTLPQAMQQAGVAYHGGDWSRAELLCRAVLKAKPDYLDALNMLGIIAAQTRRTGEAADLLGRAVAADPTDAVAHLNYGRALIELNRSGEALARFDRALKIKPDFAEVHNWRANTLKELRRFDEALQSYDRVLALEPGNAGAHNDRGVTLGELKRFDEALKSYDRALKCRPDCADAYSNRGNALQVLKRFDEALGSFDRALKQRPDFVEAHVNRGNTLHDLKRFREALESYDRALALKPDHAQAHVNKALAMLLVGDFEQGWTLNEWRWKTEALRKYKRSFVQPLWLGNESLSGKTILLHSEQGLGDTIQLCRYAGLLAERGARVVMEVEKPLAGLLKSLSGVSALIVKGGPLPSFDYHCPLLSLPLAFKTDLASIPRARKYLHADAETLASWARKLGERTRPRIGLVWSGSTGHHNDHNRSVSFSTLVKCLPPQYQYLSLQKEVRDADRDALASRPDILQFGDELRDFADTAALCELMDVVISVDTSVAHLAGALGKPVWVLLPHVPDWRWLLDREDSPWYPTARLYRQLRSGDWASVLERVGRDLAAMESAITDRDSG